MLSKRVLVIVSSSLGSGLAWQSIILMLTLGIRYGLAHDGLANVELPVTSCISLVMRTAMIVSVQNACIRSHHTCIMSSWPHLMKHKKILYARASGLSSGHTHTHTHTHTYLLRCRVKKGSIPPDNPSTVTQTQ